MLHTSSLYLFSLLSLSWGTSCSKGCRTDDWEDTNTHTWATVKFRPYDAKKSLFLQYWLMDQTCKIRLKTEKLINWFFFFFNILTWQQTVINIYIYTTQSDDGGKSYASSPLLIESSEPLQTPGIIQTLISLYEWYWEYFNKVFLLTLWQFSTTEISSFNLSCTKKLILLQNK